MNLKVIALTTLTWVVIGLVVVAGTLYSGLYDVAASAPDSAVVRWVLTTARDRSIDRQAAGIPVPPLTDPSLIEEGFEHYHEMCEGCHLAPGMASSEIREGLDPQPPTLADVVPHTSPARLFWVIKNGVRMTGMPAWGQSHCDQMIWAMTAFLEQLPRITPAEYRAMTKRADIESDPHHEAGCLRPM